MPDFAQLEAANETYVASGEHRELPVHPARRLAVVTCMDCRIDVYAVLGLELGDVHVIRTAGGRVTDDVLRSLALSNHVLGTNQVAVITHTRCGLHDHDGQIDARLREAMGPLAGTRSWFTFADPAEAAREDCELLITWPDRPNDFTVGGYVLDVADGRLVQVFAPTTADPVG